MARNAVSCGHDDDTGKAFRLRPLSGSRTATTGIVAGSVAGRSRLGVGRLEWFCGGHGPGETPGPFPNPEAKAWHGDGTALERVWESSAPPHSTLDLLVESPAGFPEGPFSYSRGGSRGVTPGGNPHFLCFLPVFASRGVREAPIPQHPPHHMVCQRDCY